MKDIHTTTSGRESANRGSGGSMKGKQDETFSLIASNKVEGTDVYDAAGNEIGEVHNLMIDKTSGQVAYAVMSFGGFLGIGEKYHAVPWKALTYDTNLGGYHVNLNKEQLKKAPNFALTENPFERDPNYGRTVSGYYGTGSEH